MIRIRLTVIGGLVLLLAGCSSTSVRFDYDRQQDFSRFKTFDFYPIPKEIGPDTNPLVIKRIQDAVIRELAHKGLSRSEDQPDTAHRAPSPLLRSEHRKNGA